MPINQRQIFPPPLFVDTIKGIPQATYSLYNPLVKKTGEHLSFIERKFDEMFGLPGKAVTGFREDVPARFTEQVGEAVERTTGSRTLGILGGLAAGIAEPIPVGKLKKSKELTTKFLQYAKGKTTLSKQEILDFARRPELKRGEADILNRLGSELQETKTSAKEFTNAVRGELLELKPVKVKDPQYDRVNIDDQVTRELSGGLTNEYEKELFKGGKIGRNYEEVVFESPITTNGSSHFPNSKNYFAHARGDEVVENGKKIWREQEIQSDLLQKDNLRATFQNDSIALRRLGTEAEHDALLSRLSADNTSLSPQELARLDELQKQMKEFVQPEIKQLDPFTNDRFGERIMRERIKEKAGKGYKAYRLPTGETIGKIEGFTEDTWTLASESKREPGRMLWSNDLLTSQNLKVGQAVTKTGDVDDFWIITDILGDGRFKAVQKTYQDLAGKNWKYEIDNSMVAEGGNPAWRAYNEKTGQSDFVSFVPSKKAEALEHLKSKHSSDYSLKELGERYGETFDLTGKSNPQYRRYEQWGKFLKNKYGGKEVIDPQGNTWMEIDLTPTHAQSPVEAFGALPFLGAMSQDESNEQPLFIRR